MVCFIDSPKYACDTTTGNITTPSTDVVKRNDFIHDAFCRAVKNTQLTTVYSMDLSMKYPAKTPKNIAIN